MLTHPGTYKKWFQVWLGLHRLEIYHQLVGLSDYGGGLEKKTPGICFDLASGAEQKITVAVFIPSDAEPLFDGGYITVTENNVCLLDINNTTIKLQLIYLEIHAIINHARITVGVIDIKCGMAYLAWRENGNRGS